ncbi:MAG: type II toxin-antitoxin system RelE/ParE family toxin [Pseudomonadota bacterium]
MAGELTIRFTKSARAELIDIAEYTAETWGEAQQKRYLSGLDDKLRLLTKHPALGKSRADLSGDVFTFPFGRHLVLYRVQDEVLQILGFPHQSMDIEKYINEVPE